MKRCSKFDVLRDVCEHPGSRYEEMGERLGVSKQRVGQWIGQLLGEGLLACELSPGRVMPGTVHLTSKGQEQLVGTDANGSPVEGE